jgi:hypothetical protein
VKSIFFWSEEHAREYRREQGGERGIYATIDQALYINRLMQSAIFGFDSRE